MEIDHKFTALLTDDGKIKRWPAKRKYQLLLIEHLSKKIPTGGVYNEKEINQLIKAEIIIDDYVLIRRELVDLGYLTRDARGMVYQKNAVIVEN